MFENYVISLYMPLTIFIQFQKTSPKTFNSDYFEKAITVTDFGLPTSKHLFTVLKLDKLLLKRQEERNILLFREKNNLLWVDLINLPLNI